MAGRAPAAPVAGLDAAAAQGQAAQYTWVTSRSASVAAQPTMSTRVSCPPSSCRWTSAAGTPCSAPSTSAMAFSACSATVRPVRAAIAIRVEAGRSVASSSTSTRTRTGHEGAGADVLGLQARQPVRPVRATARRTASGEAPADSRAPSSMSPARPVNGIEVEDHRCRRVSR